MLRLLVVHGDLLFVALLLAGGLLGGAAHVLWRRGARRRSWRAWAGQAPLRPARRLEPGDIVLVGKLDAHGAGTAAQTLAAPFDAAMHTLRAPRLSIVTRHAVVPIDGAVHVVESSQAVDADALLADARKTLPPTELALFEERALDAREVRHGAEVAVFGTLVQVASDRASYRDLGAELVLRAGAGRDGVLIARVRQRSAAIGGLVGAAAMLGVLAWAADVPLIVPWQRAEALAALERTLVNRVEHGAGLSREDAELALEAFAPAPGRTRARLLVAAGRIEEAHEEATGGEVDVLRRAKGLRDAGLHGAAYAELRRLESTEARANEVRWRAAVRYEWDLTAALNATCGSDWTCAAHPRLLWNFEPRELDVHSVLAGTSSHRDPQRTRVLLRVAGDEHVGDVAVARSRVWILLDLAAHQMRFGGIDASRRTLGRARRSIDRWPSRTRDLARLADHLESASYLFANEPDGARVHDDEEACPIAVWLAIHRDPLAADLTGLPERVRAAIETARARRSAPYDDRLGAEWTVPVVPVEWRDAVVESLRNPTTLLRLDRGQQMARARALRRLGHDDDARAIEATVAAQLPWIEW